MLFCEISIYKFVIYILLSLPPSLASSLQQIARTSLYATNAVQKRTTRTLECDHVPARSFTSDVRITAHFTTIRQMCEAYPLGMGVYCVGRSARLANRAPQSYLYYSAPNLARDLHAVCMQRCRCVNVAPGQPEIHEPSKGRLPSLHPIPEGDEAGDEELVVSQTNTASVSRPQQTDAVPDSEIFRCDGRLYGYPDDADCRAALRQQVDFGMVTDWFPREYLGIKAKPRADPLQVSGTVQTPVILTSGKTGTCAVLYLLPQIHGYRINSILVEGHELQSRSDETRQNCVQERRIGGHGSFPQARIPRGEYPRFFLNLYDYAYLSSAAGRRFKVPTGIPEIFVYSTDSPMQQFVENQFACVLDHDGNAQCHNMDTSNNENDENHQPPPEPEDEDDSHRQNVHSESVRQGCSGACYDPEDCDINRDCLCASNKGLQFSMSWGQHACMYVAGAAVAVAAAAIKPGRPCHGRCLLEEDGTLEVDAALLGSSTSSNSSTAFTDPLPLNLTNTSSTVSSSQFVTSNNSFPITSNQSFSSDTAHNQSTLNPPQNGTLLTGQPEPAPTLYCPCNCTYVSAACCLSPNVWEEPSKAVHMMPPPRNTTICCDGTSGKWLSSNSSSGSSCPPTSSSSTSEKGLEAEADFHHLGTVRWNSSAIPWELIGQGGVDP